MAINQPDYASMSREEMLALLTKPKQKRQPKRLPKIISREDAARILAVPNVQTITGLRARTILQVLYKAGLRVEELCNLIPADATDGYILIRQGKGAKDRRIPISAETSQWLTRWQEKRPQGEYLFTSHNGEKMDQSQVRKMCYLYSTKAGVFIHDGNKKRPVNPHIWRHTLATELLADGLNIREVQQILGHSSITTTQLYTHVIDEDLAAKIRGRSM